MLSHPDTTIPQILAILRQWTADTQQCLELVIREVCMSLCIPQILAILRQWTADTQQCLELVIREVCISLCMFELCLLDKIINHK